jgi:hypothetical protein
MGENKINQESAARRCVYLQMHPEIKIPLQKKKPPEKKTKSSKTDIISDSEDHLQKKE